MGGRLRQCSCAPIQQTNPPPLKQNLDKKPFHKKLAARVHAPTTPLQTLGVSALIRRFHNGVCERRAHPMRGWGLQAPFSCLARLAPYLLWLLSCCCSADPHKYRTPKSQMSNYGSEVSSIYRKPMLGTQRDVTADKTSFDNNSLFVLVYNRKKTKSKDQVSKKTLRAQHLCGSGGKSRASYHGIPSSTGGISENLKNAVKQVVLGTSHPELRGCTSTSLIKRAWVP